MRFLNRLPREDQNVDFRVLADEGGYGLAIESLYQRPTGKLAVTAQRDKKRIFLEIVVDRDKIAHVDNDFYFDGFIGEILDPDGHRTGHFVRITNLSIDIRSVRDGNTVGVLRMARHTQLPKAG